MLRQKPDRRETRTAEKDKGTIFFKKIYPTCCGTRKNTYLSALTVLNNSNLYAEATKSDSRYLNYLKHERQVLLSVT